MLGVIVTNTLSVAEHVQGIIRGCAPSIHALRVLCSRGLNDAALQTLYRAVIVARLTYATSAWWGFTTYDDRQRIEKCADTSSHAVVPWAQTLRPIDREGRRRWWNLLTRL